MVVIPGLQLKATVMVAPTYRVVLDSFHIDNTRAVDEDTDVVDFLGTLDGEELSTQHLSTGDVDNGDHLVNLQYGPIAVWPASQLELKFAVLNNGHAIDQEFWDKLDAALHGAAVAAAPFGGIYSAFVEIGKIFIDLFNIDCDGAVAGDVILSSGSELAQLTINWPHIYYTTRGYPGTDSDVGCGSNSQYSATWYVQRVNLNEPLLDLLVHLSSYGDRTWHEGQFAGTHHEGRQIEGFSLQIDPPVEGLTLSYMASLQGSGDTPWVGEGEFVGTRGESRRLEGFAIRLGGPQATKYFVQYNAQVQGRGDSLALNGAFCGTRGQGLRLEGMRVGIHKVPAGPGPS